MTDYQTTPIAAPAPKKNRPWLLPTVVGVAALFVGFAAGGAGEPAVAEPKVITETVEKEVEVSSSDCLAALDYADEGFTIMAGMMEAITDLDVAAMKLRNQELDQLSGPYNLTKASCRAGS